VGAADCHNVRRGAGYNTVPGAPERGTPLAAAPTGKPIRCTGRRKNRLPAPQPPEYFVATIIDRPKKANASHKPKERAAAFAVFWCAIIEHQSHVESVSEVCRK